MSTSSELRQAAAKLTEWKAKRDKLVNTRRAEGASLRTIATEAGVTPEGVRHITGESS